MLTYTNEVIGTVKIVQKNQTFDLELRKGNCIAVLLFKGKHEDTLMNFFADERHLRNLCKKADDEKTYNPIGYDVKEIKLNLFHKEAKILLNWFVKYYEIVCYWQK